MSPYDEVRIGDAERERAQSTLSDHYAAGRLEHDEYSERLDRVWAARTRAELDPVFTDLPGGFEARGDVGRGASEASVSKPRTSTTGAYSTPASRRPTSAVRSRGWRPPVPLLAVLVVLGTIAVLTNLPLILVGLGVWFFFLRGGGCHTQRVHPRRW